MNNSTASSKTKKEAQSALDRFKMEVASEIGVNLKEGYNGDLTSKEAGSIGGEMVRQMIKKQEESMRSSRLPCDKIVKKIVLRKFSGDYLFL